MMKLFDSNRRFCLIKIVDNINKLLMSLTFSGFVQYASDIVKWELFSVLLILILFLLIVPKVFKTF